MIKVSRLFREETITPDILQFLRDTGVGKVKKSSGPFPQSGGREARPRIVVLFFGFDSGFVCLFSHRCE